MILNHGNIKKKSHILKYHYFDYDISDESRMHMYNEYIKGLNDVPGIENYRSIQKDLHDSCITIKSSSNDIILELDIYNEQIDNYRKSLVFKNAKIISYNKILKSGHISNINKNVIPHEYLYDEIYKDGINYYITIIITTKPRIKINNYYPLITIRFERIDSIES
jgi:hypothetical protein